MKKHLITIFTIFLIITSGVNFVSAQNITEETITNTILPQENEANTESNIEESESENKRRIGETVKSQENGHFNITFDDGYNGYCINYGEHEASYDDKFVVQNTESAINNKNGESVGHYLKTFFVEFHDIAVKNKIDTQKIIWSFTDDFKFNDTLKQIIKDTSIGLIIPDHGAVKKINNTTEAVFDFEVLGSTKFNHQNFFGYKIIYRNITNEIINNSTEKEENYPNLDIPSFDAIPENKTEQNQTTNPTQNKTEQNQTIIIQSNSEKTTPAQTENDKTQNKQNNLLKHTTGYEVPISILLILILGSILIIKYRRD